jgi:hypothetical protein
MTTLITQTARLNATQLVEKCKFIEARMDGNPAFPDPTPKLSEIVAAREALETAITGALDGGRTAVAIRRERQKELKLLLDQLAGYVSSVAEGNALAILSMGFGVKRQGSPVGDLLAPADLQADISSFAGRVDLRWKPVRGAVAYHLYLCRTEPSASATWEQVAVSTRAATKVVGLTSGQTFWFRVAAIGTAGVGPLSEVAHTLVR